MDIQKLTQDYQRRFNEHAEAVEKNMTRKRGKKKLLSPNFLKEVVRPILDELALRLPEYGFKKTTDDYAMYGEYYRIKAGIILIGGFTIDEEFGLIYTPLFHGRPCGECSKITNIEQLVSIIRLGFEQRDIRVKMKYAKHRNKG